MSDRQTPDTKSSQSRALVALVVCNIFWGISFPLMSITNQLAVKYAVPTKALFGWASSEVLEFNRACAFLGIRFFVALILLFVCAPTLLRQTTRGDWLRGLSTGLVISVGMILQVVGLRTIPASRSAFLTALSVIFTPALMIILEKKIPRFAVCLGCIVAFLGAAILTEVVEPMTFSWRSFEALNMGDLYTTAAALDFAFSIILIDTYSSRMPSARLTPGMFLGISAFTLPLVLIATETSAEQTFAEAWGGLFRDKNFCLLTLLMSFFCTVLPFHLMNKYQACFSPAHASLIYTLEPICATLWAFFLPGMLSPLVGIDYPSEVPGLPLLLGGSAILIGNVIALLPLGKSRQEG